MLTHVPEEWFEASDGPPSSAQGPISTRMGTQAESAAVCVGAGPDGSDEPPGPPTTDRFRFGQ
jgi:hypothetical protein